MTAQVPYAHLGGPFSIFSLVALFGRVHRVAPCEVAWPGTFESGRAISFEGARISFAKL